MSRAGRDRRDRGGRGSRASRPGPSSAIRGGDLPGRRAATPRAGRPDRRRDVRDRGQPRRPWSTGSAAAGRRSGAWSWPRATRSVLRDRPPDHPGARAGTRSASSRRVSSMQLAFARVGLVLARRGDRQRPRPAARARPCSRCSAGPRSACSPRTATSPSEVAAFFLDRGLRRLRRLGLRGPRDARRVGDRRRAARPRRPPVRRPERPDPLPRAGRRPRSSPRCPTDDAFARPESGPVLLTHADVRARCVRPVPRAPRRPDLGHRRGARRRLRRAGAGVPRTGRSWPSSGRRSRSAILRTNRARFEAYNLRIVEGEAPGCLDGEEPPAGVFLGGSGGRLDPILDLVVRSAPARGSSRGELRRPGEPGRAPWNGSDSRLADGADPGPGLGRAGRSPA